MKFAHLADCHVGAYGRDAKLREVNRKYFIKAIDFILEEKVDFVLFAGDLFNTAVPGIESIKLVVIQLKRLKDDNIPVYFIAGSHDFSPGGKTMLDVLEKADLGINVAKGESYLEDKYKPEIIIDKKTGVGLAGISGKKGGLDKKLYHKLHTEHFKEHKDFKIFMFHSTLTELKPKEMKDAESMPLSLLPEGFDYYAAGHVHIVDNYLIDGYNIVYPGPIFPNNFGELEKLKKGGFYIVEDKKTKFIALDDYPVVSFVVHCKGKTPSEIEDELKSLVIKNDVKNAIVTLRIQGEINGKPSDVDLNEVNDLFIQAGAFVVLKNTHKLSSKEFQSVNIDAQDVADVEDELISKHTDQNKLGDDITKSLINALSAEKLDGEKQLDYEKRLFSDVDKVLELAPKE